MLLEAIRAKTVGQTSACSRSYSGIPSAGIAITWAILLMRSPLNQTTGAVYRRFYRGQKANMHNPIEYFLIHFPAGKTSTWKTKQKRRR
jgi:hypothetical protein